MKLQKMPRGIHLCGAYSLAMCLDVDVEQVLFHLPDGMEKYDNLGDCLSYRGHHPDELIDVAWLNFGRHLKTITCGPAMETRTGDVVVYDDNITRMSNYMRKTRGMIYCDTINGNPHMVAYEGFEIYDPSRGQTDQYIKDFKYLYILI